MRANGYCQCGCGETTSLATQTNHRLGHQKGQPVFYVRGHANRRATQYLEEDRGYDTPCWIWQLWRTGEGYGKLSDGAGVQRLAHRVMWAQANGPIPDGLQIDHLCRQPSCVNPDHLEPVTAAENARRSRSAKLDWPAVREIRRALGNGASQKALAERYAVCIATIGHIASGRNWRE